jgi:mitochondrial cardiolipin hydrolase
MDLDATRRLLNESYEDFKLSRPEQQALLQRIESLTVAADDLNFIRNRAFELVADHYRYQQSHYLESLKWLEEVVRTIDTVKNQRLGDNEASIQNNAYFSPGDECASKIKSLLNRAQKTIDVCVFTLSDDTICNTLISAHQRQVKVRIITDNDKTGDLGSDVARLASAGIETKIDRTSHHMHHKFALIDHSHLITGSFNWTRSATHYNQENIIVSNDKTLLGQFNKEFNQLWSQCQWFGQ